MDTQTNGNNTKKKREFKDGESAARVRGALESAKDLKDRLTVMAGDADEETALAYVEIIANLKKVGDALVERNKKYVAPSF